MELEFASMEKDQLISFIHVPIPGQVKLMIWSSLKIC